MSPADKSLPPPAPTTAHLSAAVLRQYAAGTLSPAERRRVEYHALDCALCADALEGYQLAAPAAVTPVALAGLQQRLHARVGAEEGGRAPRAGTWWMAAAAAVAVLLLALGLWTRQSPRPPAPLTSKPVAPAGAPAAAPAPPPAVAAEPAAADSVAVSVATVRPSAEPTAAVGRRAARRRPTRSAVAARAASQPQPAKAADMVELSGLEAADTAPAAIDAGADVAAVMPPPAAPAEAKEEAAPTAEAEAPGKAVAKARMAEAAPAGSTPAEPAPASPPETGKRKAALPAAPDLAPFPAGGYTALRTYLRREQKRPVPGLGSPAPTEGVVKLKFTVEADGSVHNIQVVRGISPEHDEEAIRLICEGPAWRPAIINGRRAAQAVRLDVPFH